MKKNLWQMLLLNNTLPLGQQLMQIMSLNFYLKKQYLLLKTKSMAFKLNTFDSGILQFNICMNIFISIQNFFMVTLF